MKKLTAVISACLVVASVFAIVPAKATTYNEVVLKHTPVLDGRLDAEYLKSFYIDHEWPERNSENYWGKGKFEFYDIEKDEYGYPVDGSIGYNTAYGWDLRASSYFLWDDDNLYIVVDVTDDDYGCVDDAHYAMAAADTGNWGPWLQDSIAVNLSYSGKVFTVRADRAGRYASVFREPNYGEQVWCDMYSWFEHTKNKDAGYFATAQTDKGYLVELKIPVSEDIKADLLKDNGEFRFGMSVVDAPEDAEYDYDYANLQDYYDKEGYVFKDFMVHVDCIDPIDRKPDQKIILSDRTPFDEEAPDVPVTDEAETTVSDTAVEDNRYSPATGESGFVFACVTLAAGACFVAIKRRK